MSPISWCPRCQCHTGTSYRNTCMACGVRKGPARVRTVA